MSLTLRILKGSELTYAEMDDNLVYLRDMSVAAALSDFEEETESFNAVTGKTYLVTPDASSTVTATLPDPGSGRMAFRLEDASDDRLLSINPGSNAIEGETATHAMTIDFAGQVVTLTWDGTVWRVS